MMSGNGSCKNGRCGPPKTSFIDWRREHEKMEIELHKALNRVKTLEDRIQVLYTYWEDNSIELEDLKNILR